MRNWLTNYFTFTKNEQRGVVLLVVLSVFALLVPSVYLYFKPTPPPVVDAAFNSEVEAFNKVYAAQQASVNGVTSSSGSPADISANSIEAKKSAPKYVANETSPTFSVNINTATATDFEKLKGIGSVLGGRIVKFRTILGGFAAKEQLKEVYGLPDSTYQGIKQQLVVNKGDVKKIGINTADYKTLKSHPYIKTENAKLIEAFRKKQGGFKDLGELKNVMANDSLYKKLRPYLSLD